MALKHPDHWPAIEAFVRHMCQVAQENGPVAARSKIDETMPKLREKFVKALEDERQATYSQYEM